MNYSIAALYGHMTVQQWILAIIFSYNSLFDIIKGCFIDIKCQFAILCSFKSERTDVIDAGTERRNIHYENGELIALSDI